MAKFLDVFERALKGEKLKVVSINRNLMQISLSTKKNPGFIKFAVSDEVAQSLMRNKESCFMFHMDGEELNAIADEIDAENGVLPQANESNESA